MEIGWNKSQIAISNKEVELVYPKHSKKHNFTRSPGVVLEEKSQQIQNLLKQKSWAKELSYLLKKYMRGEKS